MNNSQRDEILRLKHLYSLAAGAYGQSGLGDDAAVLPLPSGHSLVVSQDMAVDGYHFLSELMSEQEIAKRTLHAALSDLVAMGVPCHHVFLSLALPKHSSLELEPLHLNLFFEEVFGISKVWSFELSGGDTVETSGPLVIDWNVLGVTGENPLLQRGTLRAGQKIWSSGPLGGSKLHLNWLKEGRPNAACQAYLSPPLRWKEVASVRNLLAGGTDISDGLPAELEKLSAIEGVGFDLHLSPKVHLHPDCLSHHVGNISPEQAFDLMRDSDDYEMLVWTNGEVKLPSPWLWLGTVADHCGVQLRDSTE